MRFRKGAALLAGLALVAAAWAQDRVDPRVRVIPIEVRENALAMFGEVLSEGEFETRLQAEVLASGASEDPLFRSRVVVYVSGPCPYARLWRVLRVCEQAQPDRVFISADDRQVPVRLAGGGVSGAPAGEGAGLPTLRLVLAAQGSVELSVEGERCEGFASLRAALAATRARSAFLRVDDAVPYAFVRAALTACAEAGARPVLLRAGP
ncbi:MAG: hypothetical protein ACYTFT_06645 [Planctomycetota bacterium]